MSTPSTCWTLSRALLATGLVQGVGHPGPVPLTERAAPQQRVLGRGASVDSYGTNRMVSGRRRASRGREPVVSSHEREGAAEIRARTVSGVGTEDRAVDGQDDRDGRGGVRVEGPALRRDGVGAH